ncbi:hypothetical protein ASE70_15910 [Sphingomonas sp. Leaf22]|uniref:DUF5694 domain-containing protein n=1 Tax=Sphingomonas sp. Leaf22 TaxID=1735687 RepID=UPI000701E2E5|nr:DUF5694 domain-containing protein [Sphingomonas sp. Leaf22]KQM89996.1 hypothetical protein ASE70_15910 [Sphingomonas sp. Leaf22]
MRGKPLWGIVAAAMLLWTANAAAQQKPVFDPTSWKRDVAGPPTRVMVLASTHLKNLPGFKPEWMGLLLDRLAAYKPSIITIEALSGQECDQLRRYPATYPGVAGQYCPTVDDARMATGLDVPQATSQAAAMLAAWPERPTPAARRRLASVFLAGGEPASALVQWLRLDPGERHDGDGLDEALVKRLGTLMASANENYQIGAALAARHGLERVYPIDDHTADGAMSEEQAFGKAIQRLWSTPGPNVEKLNAQAYESPADMLATFRLNNRVDIQIGGIEGDFGRALKDRTPELWGRQYVSWWEIRNLRMVANIRATFAQQPGARVLTIVGAAHKPYFDAYLNLMHEVELVDVNTAL